MQLPDHINGRWIATLDNDQLIVAESALHTVFHDQELIEKLKDGTRYKLLNGSALLVNAWHRWQLVNNETRHRRLVIHRRPVA